MIPTLLVDQYMNPLSTHFLLWGLVPVNTWITPGKSGPVLVVQVDLSSPTQVPPLQLANALQAL